MGSEISLTAVDLNVSRQSFIKTGAGVFFFGATDAGATCDDCFSGTGGAGVTSVGWLLEMAVVVISSAGRGRGNGGDEAGGW